MTFFDTIEDKTNFLKRLSFVNFIIAILTFNISLIIKPADGFEISLYAMYPNFFWLFLIACIYISIIILLLSNYWKIYNYWKLAFISALMINSVLLILPLLRGYYMHNWGDTPAHLSWAQHILNTGTFNTDYPFLHIRLVVMFFSGVSLENAALLFPIITMFVCTLSLTILGKTLLSGLEVSLLPVIFSLPLLLISTGLSAETPAKFTLILIIYIIFKSHYMEKRVVGLKCLITILIITTVFSHPLLTLNTIIILLGLLFLNKLFTCSIQFDGIRKLIFFSIVILSTTMIYWYFVFQYRKLESLISIIEINFFGLEEIETESIIQTNIEIVHQSGVSLLRFIEVFTIHHGIKAIFLSIAMILCVYVLINYLNKKQCNTQFVFSVLYIISLILFAITIFGHFIIGSLGRAMSTALIIATIFIPLALQSWLKNTSNKKIIKYTYISLVFLFIIVFALSTFTLYSSPINYSKNTQFTYHDKHGYDWFFIHRDNLYSIINSESTWNHFKYEIYFNEFYHGKPLFVDSMPEKVPLKTVYNEHFSLADALPQSNYYYLSNERSLPNVVHVDNKGIDQSKSIANYVKHRLKQDNSINLIYHNGEFESWGVFADPN